MRIDKNSKGTVALVLVCGAVAIYLTFRFLNVMWLKWILIAAFFWFCCWQTAFHMVPNREKKGSSNLVSSVADGKIVILEKIFEQEYLKRECIMLSVYMDFWDVHANFWPIDGEVVYFKYYPGSHHLAFKPKASDENEHACTAVRNADGKDIFFKQIAGTFARRLVCYSEPGMKTRAGDQCGIIKFGSRIDMYLPLDARIFVELGQEVRASETILAEI